MGKFVAVIIIGFLLLSGCKPRIAMTEKSGLVMSRMYENKWTSVVQSTTNLDSLICEYIEKNKKVEMVQNTFDILSEAQKNSIITTKEYGGCAIEFISKKEENSDGEHPARLLFNIYEKYFDHLEPGDLGLEVVVTKSTLEGSKDLYLLQKNSKGYTISYLLGTFGL